MARFDAYAALLADWQTRMNLVGPSTLPHVWERHFADSAQLATLAPAGATWLDIGAGAGFPGLVLALLGHGPVHLVESVGKKARFLDAAVETLGLTGRAIVHHARVESLPASVIDVITARACAALDRLFEWGRRFAGPDTLWLLPKGASVAAELAAAHRRWRFDAELAPSRTDPSGRIVVARGVRPR